MPIWPLMASCSCPEKWKWYGNKRELDAGCLSNSHCMDSFGSEHSGQPGHGQVQQDDAVIEFTVTFVCDHGTQLGAFNRLHWLLSCDMNSSSISSLMSFWSHLDGFIIWFTVFNLQFVSCTINSLCQLCCSTQAFVVYTKPCAAVPSALLQQHHRCVSVVHAL